MVYPKTWAYSNMESGRLKTNAGTNKLTKMGPQNNMYLSTPKEIKMIEIIGTYFDSLR